MTTSPHFDFAVNLTALNNGLLEFKHKMLYADRLWKRQQIHVKYCLYVNKYKHGDREKR
jgi:hypothetical protein